MTFYEHIAALRQALGGRRFLLSAGAGIVNTLLVIHGVIPAAIYESLTIATVGIYIAGRGAQAFIERKAGGSNVQQANS